MKIIIVGDQRKLVAETRHRLSGLCLPHLDIQEMSPDQFYSGDPTSDLSHSLIMLSLDNVNTDASKDLIGGLKSRGAHVVCFTDWSSNYRKLRQCLDAGADDFFLQPVDQNELKQLIEKYSVCPVLEETTNDHAVRHEP